MHPDLESLECQRDEIGTSLRLIAEHKAKYIAATEIPLQLLKDEQDLKKRLADVEQQLAELLPPIAPASSPWLIPSVAFLVVLAVMGLGFVLKGTGTIIFMGIDSSYIPFLSPSPSPTQGESPADPTMLLPQQQLVPTVVGLQIAYARVILIDAGFQVVELAYSDLRFPDGYVGEQFPLPNQPAPDGIVTLSVVVNGLLDDDGDDDSDD